MELKQRYFWNNKVYFISGNLGIGFTEYEQRAKTSELMSFIGLLDKQRKEIYEGDILKYSFQKKQTLSWPVVESISPGWEIWEVKYIAPSFVYIIHSQDNSYYGELPSKPRVISSHYLDAVEVIGNIYENPNLIAPKT